MDGRSGTLDRVTVAPQPQHVEGVELQALAEVRKDDIEALARRYGISNLRLFGSVARGDSGPVSDIDFLVDLPPTATLFDLVGFRRELDAMLGVDVDVVSSRALLPRDGDVLEEVVAL
jgi:uncharacterized protein